MNDRHAIPRSADFGAMTALADNIQKPPLSWKVPDENLVICIGSFRVYAYDNVANIINIVNIYIPFRSQPRDLKIQTPIAPSWLHSKSIVLRVISPALSAVMC